MKDKEILCPKLRIVAAIDDKQYIEAANIAGEGRAEVIYTKEAISRIIANTCRQHGLSQVLTELFNYGGHELYFEDVPLMEGKTFKEAILCFSNAMVVGICSNNQAYLNPPMDTVITKEDQLILLEEDDGVYQVHDIKEIQESLICEDGNVSMEISDNLVVLGSNDKLPIILSEYNKYVDLGTRVIIVDDDMDDNRISTYENLDVTVCKRKITRDLLCEFLEDNVNNILLLNDDSEEAERSDSYTLLRLILLRDIADKNARDFAITTEMRSADNQRLATQARVDDFVIGSNFASLLMVQISENHMMRPLIEELLDESGSELYMKPVANYVTIGQPVDSYVLAESAARKGEVYIGYRHMGTEHSNVVVNPNKEDKIVFGENDQIVVIAEN